MPTPPQVSIMLDDGKGNQHTEVLRGPGGTIRFAVGEPSRHAAVWKVWATPKNSSVYVAIRSIGGYQKISLHQNADGSDWRVQWTAEHMRENPQIGDRVIDEWDRPPEVGETGWRRGVSICTRHRDVVPAPSGESLPSDILWIPEPPDGYAMNVTVVVARPKNMFVDMKGAVPFDAFVLENGQVVLLAATRQEVTDELNAKIDSVVAQLIGAAGAALTERGVETPGALRALVWGNGPDGDRHAWDVVVEPGDISEQS